MNEWEMNLDFLEDRSRRIIGSGSIMEGADTAFYEMADDVKALRSKLVRMFEHLLKLAYVSSMSELSRDCSGWKASVREPAQHIRDITNGFDDKNMTRKLMDLYEDGYLRGLQKYKNASKGNPALQENLKKIPTTLPWKKEDLNNFIMDNGDNILYMILQLPDTSGLYEVLNIEEFDDLDFDI